MKNSIKARMLVQSFDAAKQELEEFYAPFVQDWLQIQYAENKLTKEEIENDFHFDSASENAHEVYFASEDWEETWQYGGYEKHYGREIAIPFEFFDNPVKYNEKAQALKKLRELEQEAARLAAQQENVKRLQRKLELAQAELNQAELDNNQ